MSFLRKPIAFARITWDARADDVLPCRRPSSIARHDVIEIQLVALKNLAAILAGVFVTLENIQHNHARHADPPRNCRDHFVFRRGHGKIAPTLEIVRHEIVGFIRRNNAGMARVHQRERASRRADVHRLPETIQHQNVTVQQCMQISMVNYVVRLLRTST